MKLQTRKYQSSPFCHLPQDQSEKKTVVFVPDNTIQHRNPEERGSLLRQCQNTSLAHVDHGQVEFEDSSPLAARGPDALVGGGRVDRTCSSKRRLVEDEG